MAADPLDSLRLALMQDVLPLGLAVVERARRGGPAEVLAAFDGSSADPLGQLRQEGEPAASQVRENLDRFQPGLGNPVMKVEVRDVDAEDVQVVSGPEAPPPVWDTPATPTPADPAELLAALARIEERLALLQSRIA
ncbi:hypothetical protein [Cyanobium sp. N5-Cardenillas]|uniref:hypothetical protein n=1 Tax=Cyanobium sp. N5-Cardenillas TaxID=2823720 RepID=UPI0020CFE7E8|nr:hypothetical protein [Cyanobium sp. N5-Cardenillas]MCP9786190.1 hypothetical protein [Cyanobium sp. N5-Cardenillas]